MNRRVFENALYVLQEEWTSYLKLTGAVFFVVFGFLLAKGYITTLEAEAGVLAAQNIAKEHSQDNRYSFSFESARASLTIPALGVAAPIVFVDSTDPDMYVEPLKRGIAYYPSAIPGKSGTAIFLGHSAPFGWFSSSYENVFSDLDSLQKGDIITLHLNGSTYEYAVSNTFRVQKGAELPEYVMRAERSRIVLLSCWPPGQDKERIVVQADRI